jgi:hypothetical protein
MRVNKIMILLISLFAAVNNITYAANLEEAQKFFDQQLQEYRRAGLNLDSTICPGGIISKYAQAMLDGPSFETLTIYDALKDDNLVIHSETIWHTKEEGDKKASEPVLSLPLDNNKQAIFEDLRFTVVNQKDCIKVELIEEIEKKSEK